MKKRILSFLLAFCLAAALLPTAALAATTNVSKIVITMTAPAEGQPLPTDAKTSSTANTQVTNVEWSGETDNGNMIAGKDYTATITVEIKPDKDAKFTTGSINTTVNGSSAGVKVTRMNSTKVKITYTLSKTTADPTPINSPKITMTAPEVGKPLPATAKASSACTVTKVEWSGQLDENGNMAYETEYTAVFTLEISDRNYIFGKNADGIAKNSTLNGDYVFKSAERLSDTVVRLTYVLPAVKKPSTTISKLDNIHIDSPSVGRAPDDSGYTGGKTAKVKVTDTKWSGKVDNYGLAMAGVAYTYTFTVEIKPEYDLTFSTGTLKATINSNTEGVTVQRLSDKTAIVTYTFPALEEKVDTNSQKELERRWSQAEADAAYPLNDPLTIVVNEDTMNMETIEELLSGYYIGIMNHDVYDLVAYGDYHTLDGRVINWDDYPRIKADDHWHKFPTYQVTRVVYDLWFPADYSVARFPNEKELWLSPKCDIQGILNRIAREVYDEGSDRKSFYTYDHTLFIPESLYPNGPTYNTDAKGIPGCRIMLYSGDDVYAAAAKGASAARDWCTNHTYTAEIFSPDRLHSHGGCQSHRTFYYSCSKCGKCEYNPNHLCVYTPLYMQNDGIKFTLDSPANYACDYSARIVSDEHFLGVNDQGDRVYLTSCIYCGRDNRQFALGITHDYYKNVMGMDDSDPSYYPLYMESEKKSWSPGGTAYKNAMEATPVRDSLSGFVVTADHFVTARTSGWATQDVQVAANDGLVDKALLGDDYTGTINRLQFCSIAVKMTEKMLGKTITPAPADSFTDTDNEYVLKAVTAGITNGVGEGRFDPSGTLNRQQMATFLYRALQYVKANSATEYTVYTSRLGSYSDSGQIEDWAKKSMEFMNALGLIGGTSDTTLSPSNPCTIEQALIVADRSLDAGTIGWYQMNKVSNRNGFVDYSYGDRIWITSADGTFTNRYGRQSTIGSFSSFYAIKDR